MENSSNRVFLITNGCPENRIDIAHVQRFFEANRWTVTDSYLDADLIVFNSCGLTQLHEDASLQIIDTLKKYKPAHARLVISGCLPRINPGALTPHGDAIVVRGEQEVGRLNDIIDAQQPIQACHANFVLPLRTLREKPSPSGIYPSFFDLLLKPRSDCQGTLERLTCLPLLAYDRWLDSRVNLFPRNKSACFIKISTGCLNACAYCAVKNSRGALRSKHPDQILTEFREGLARGSQSVSLLGTDLGPYGRDLGTDLTTLLDRLVRERGNFEIRLRNVEPQYLIRLWPTLQEVLASGKITFLGIPIESGSDIILKAMRRGYAIDEVKACVRDLTKRFPWIFIRNQLMGGFPGETEQQFQETMRLIDDLVFDYTEVYVFSARLNTAAAAMKDQVPVPVRRHRRNQLWRKSLLAHTPQRLRKLRNSNI